MCILVIEDTKVLRQEITATLEFEGFEAAAAENGVAGLEIATIFRPDLILCDVRMPKLGGLEFLEAYQAADGDALGFPATSAVCRRA